MARRLGLAVVTSDALTILRTRRGRGFSYLDPSGRKVDAARRREIEALGLPPAWEDVVIAADPQAHLQALGRDAKSRMQYRYHERWSAVRDAVKAERLRMFGRALPRIRAAVERDMKRALDDPRAVAATAVRLIDRQLVRVGGEVYARQGTRGASTLTKRNALVGARDVKLRYRAKAGKKVELRLRDEALKRRLRRLATQRAPQTDGRLFAYRGTDGKWRSLKAPQINSWLAEAAEAPVTAKDFRTFGGSSLALALLCDAEPDTRNGEWTAPARRRATAGVMRDVAERLRNTPAVTRSSYVHPSIVEAFERDELDCSFLRGRMRMGLSREETALMRFLEN